MNDWMLPKITDYWDEQVRAIDGLSGRLNGLEGAERDAALDDIRAATEHTRVLPDELLLRVALPFVEDLYKAAAAATIWDVDIKDYLVASAGTFTWLLAMRGCLIQYLINNAWEDLTKPCRLLGPWFTADGLCYACTQAEAEYLLRQDSGAATIDVGDPVWRRGWVPTSIARGAWSLTS